MNRASALAVCDAPPKQPIEMASGSEQGGWEQRCQEHFNTIALAVLAAALGIRVFAAWGTYLNADEGLHYILINQPSALLAYKASLTNAHPPLVFLMLYCWHFFGRSEFMLRLPLVISGAAFCWFLFKWIVSMFGKPAGMTGLIIAAFCPALVNISAEVREYSLLLACMAAALYFLERAFQEASVLRIWYFSGCLYLAILSHYSAIFFAGAVGLYALMRITSSKLPRNFVTAWTGGQAGALAIYGLLYITHVSKVKANIAAWGQPFFRAHFHAENGDLADFTRTQTVAVFQYLFQQPRISQAMLFVFLAGVVLVFVRGLPRGAGGSSSRQLATLLILPFVLVWGAAVAGIYPYLGSRHTIFLAPFVIAASSFLIAWFTQRKLWIGIPLAIALMTATNASGSPPQPYIERQDQNRALITSAVNYLREALPPGDALFVDFQSNLLLRYYLCDPKEIVPVDDASHPSFMSFSCGGRTVISLNESFWRLTTGNFSGQFVRMARDYSLKSGDRVWVFEAGWGANLNLLLPKYFPEFRCITARRFGANITVMPFIVGPDLAPLVNCGI